MAAAALLTKKSKPTETDIEGSVTNIRRRGTNARIRKAILTVAG
jgi:aerobic-type carbon monoxide dehydrogenase small subunit (CoxS/CutS family)